MNPALPQEFVKDIESYKDIFLSKSYTDSASDLVSYVLMFKGIECTFEKHTIHKDSTNRDKGFIDKFMAVIRDNIKRHNIDVFRLESHVIFYNETGMLGSLRIIQHEDWAIYFNGTSYAVQAINEVIEKSGYIKHNQKINRITVETGHSGPMLVDKEIEVNLNPPITDIHKFYPYLNKTPIQTWKEFEASSSKCLLMIGAPGTGKTSYIQELITTRGIDSNIYLIDSHTVIQHNNLVDHLRELKGKCLLIVEDADTLLSKRENGNAVMSGLLNLTAGLSAIDLKIIFTTNLPNVKSIDPALIRPGRLHEVIEFKELHGDDVNIVREAAGMEPIDISINKPITLAQALNYKEIPKPVTSISPKRIGF